jgi:hypothetical protein
MILEVIDISILRRSVYGRRVSGKGDSANATERGTPSRATRRGEPGRGAGTLRGGAKPTRQPPTTRNASKGDRSPTPRGPDKKKKPARGGKPKGRRR